MHSGDGLAALGLFGGLIGLVLLVLAAVYGILYFAIPFYVIAATNRLTSLLEEVRQLRKDIHDLNAFNQRGSG